MYEVHNRISSFVAISVSVREVFEQYYETVALLKNEDFKVLLVTG